MLFPGLPDIRNLHAQKFFPRISVILNRGVVHVEIFQAIAIKHEHGVRMIGEKEFEIYIGMQRKRAQLVAGFGGAGACVLIPRS